jgi:hypothetical protein
VPDTVLPPAVASAALAATEAVVTVEELATAVGAMVTPAALALNLLGGKHLQPLRFSHS